MSNAEQFIEICGNDIDECKRQIVKVINETTDTSKLANYGLLLFKVMMIFRERAEKELDDLINSADVQPPVECSECNHHHTKCIC